MYSNNSDACALAHFPMRTAAKRALERCDEIARYFYKRPRRRISKQRPSKEVDNDIISAHSDVDIDVFMDTDNIELDVDNGPLEFNADVHKEPSVHSFDSSSTNNESHNDSETHENIEVHVNANKENEEFSDFNVVADIVMHEETNDHSLEAERNIPNQSDVSSQSSPRSESPAGSLSPEHDDGFSSHTDPSTASEIPLSPLRDYNIIKFHSGSGMIQTFGTTVIISFKGKTDQQIPFVFQNEISNRSE